MARRKQVYRITYPMGDPTFVILTFAFSAVVVLAPTANADKASFLADALTFVHANLTTPTGPEPDRLRTWWRSRS
jgi:hypothetical protein